MMVSTITITRQVDSTIYMQKKQLTEQLDCHKLVPNDRQIVGANQLFYSLNEPFCDYDLLVDSVGKIRDEIIRKLNIWRSVWYGKHQINTRRNLEMIRLRKKFHCKIFSQVKRV